MLAGDGGAGGGAEGGGVDREGLAAAGGIVGVGGADGLIFGAPGGE
jgi:hypothetical protein